MIESFFTPKKVAVIGASRDPHKLGYGVIRNLLKYKFKGEIFPVNKNASEIQDISCYSSIDELPDGVELAVVVLPASVVPKIIEQCGSKGIKNAIVVSGGFSETGEEGKEREEKLMQVAKKHGVRIIGPNCIGTIDTHASLNTTFVVGMPEQGGIGFISQSGAMVAAVIDWARGAGVGFSRIVSLGNQIDVTETEMINLIGNDRQTEVITAYAEGVSNGMEFLNISREIARKKPFVILKGGQSEKGAEAVSSHTGALSGSKEAYSAAFRKCGVLEAKTMEEMFDWARALAWQPLPKGKRVAVLTNAGGPAILAVDALEKVGLEMAPLTEDTKAYLKKRLPKAASSNNPVDVLAGSGPATYTLALEALLTDETVDAVIVIQAPQDWFLPASLAEVVGETAGLHDKPVIGSIMGKASVDEALKILHKRRVPNVAFPERAASILSAMVQRKEWMNSEYHQPEDDAEFIPADAESMIENEQWEKLIEAYGIELPEQRTSKNLESALEASNQIGYPVVMKMIAEGHTHKSDIGGVQIDLRNDEELEKAWGKIVKAADNASAKMDGVFIQKMLQGGQEVIIGIKQDEQFGPLVLFGTGGTDVELYKDVETAIAPLSESEATKLIESTIAGKKLKGWRNLPPADIQAVKKALINMSKIAINHSEIKEMEINPLFVLTEGEGAFAIDIRGSK